MQYIDNLHLSRLLEKSRNFMWSGKWPPCLWPSERAEMALTFKIYIINISIMKTDEWWLYDYWCYWTWIGNNMLPVVCHDCQYHLINRKDWSRFFVSQLVCQWLTGISGWRTWLTGISGWRTWLTGIRGWRTWLTGISGWRTL